MAAQGEPQEDDAETVIAYRERKGFADILEDAIWYGTPGACRRVKVAFGSVRASILLHRDVPAILRVSKRREMFRRDRLIADAPHYIERLGFECALAGSERGRLILYYAALPEDKFMVYDVWFRNLDTIKVEMQRRLDLLEAGAPPSELPGCQPGWLSRFCDFAPACGCGDTQEATPHDTATGLPLGPHA